MIKIGDYFIPLDKIGYIKLIGSSGCVVVTEVGTLNIINVPEEDLKNLKAICFRKDV